MRARGIDLRIYGEAVPLLVRNPALLLAPLMTGVLDVLVQQFARAGSYDLLGGIGGSIIQLLIFLIDSFGLAVSVIIADRIWRHGRASFEEGWNESRRRAGDIFLAALGLNFIVYVALQIGSYVSPWLGEALFLIAFFFLIYTIPAAAIGGGPGFMALNSSIERVRANYGAAIVLAVCFVVLYWLIGTIAVTLYTVDLGLVSRLLSALVKAIALGYFSLVLAKVYESVSFLRY